MGTFDAILGLLLTGATLSPYASGQIPNRPTSVADTIQSVEIGAGNRVTFSIYAPKASAVTVSGDFLQGAGPANLTGHSFVVGRRFLASVLPQAFH